MSLRQRWLVLVCALWFFPSLFFWAGCGVFLRMTEEEAGRRAREELAARLEEIARKSDDKTFWETRLRKDFEPLLRMPVKTPAFEKAWAEASSRYPSGMIDVIACDDEGGLVGDRRFSGVLPVLQYLQGTSIENPRIMSVATEPLRPFFYDPGAVFENVSVQEPGTFIRPDIRPGQPSSFPAGVVHFREKTFLRGRLRNILVLVYHPGDWPEFIIESLMETEQTPQIRVGYYDGPNRFRMPDSLGMPAERFVVLNRSQAGSDFAVGRTQVRAVRLEGETLLVGTAVSENSWRLFFRICLVIFIIISIYAMMHLYRHAERGALTLPLEGKLLALFLLGVLFPAGISAALAWRYVGEARREALVQSRESAARALENVESVFEAYCRDVEIRFHRLEDEFRRDAGAFRKICAHIDRLLRERRLEDAFIVSPDGKIARSWNQKLESNEARILELPRDQRVRVLRRYVAGGLKMSSGELAYFVDPEGKEPTSRGRSFKNDAHMFHKAFGMIGGEILQDEDRKRGTVRQSRPSPADEAARAMIAGEMSGVFDMVKRTLGSLSYFSYQGGRGYLYSSLLHDPSGNSAYFWILIIPGDLLEEDCFSEFFRSEPPESDQGRILLVPLPEGSRNPGFPATGEFEALVPLAKRMRRTLSLGWTGWETIDGRACDVVMRRMPAIREYYVAHATPLEEIERRLAPVIRRAVGFWCGSLLLGMCLVSILAARLLEPIRLMVQGIGSVRERRLDFALPVLSNDEMGMLSREFNRTLAHLREMELASVIQVSLQPAPRLLTKPYEILGKNRMTQAIGGDYFDYFPLAGGKLVFILGDVSGHGVSAALVAAMAKAGFAILFSRPDSTPETVLQEIHTHFLDILNKKKMMTCFVGVLDPGTGTAVVANAGQCFPLLVSEDGTSEFVELPGMPLGIAKKLRLGVGRLDLNGKTLVLYSDCLVESLDERGEAVGYPAVQEMLDELVRGGNDWGPELLFERVRQRTGSVPWEDDATVVIVRETGPRSAGEL